MIINLPPLARVRTHGPCDKFFGIYFILIEICLVCAKCGPEEEEEDDRRCDEKCIMHNKYDKNYLMFSALCTCFFAIALALAPSLSLSLHLFSWWLPTHLHTHRARITDRHPSKRIVRSFCSFWHKYFPFFSLLLLCSLFAFFFFFFLNYYILHDIWITWIYLCMHWHRLAL